MLSFSGRRLTGRPWDCAEVKVVLCLPPSNAVLACSDRAQTRLSSSEGLLGLHKAHTAEVSSLAVHARPESVVSLSQPPEDLGVW